MSISETLQAFLRARLIETAAVAELVAGEMTELVAGKVVDDPKKPVSHPYISFGPSDVTPEDADCLDGRVETQQIDVWSDAPDGKAEAKRICDAVRKALHGYSGAMSQGALVEASVTLVRVIADPQEGITHGILTVECLIEE